MEYLRVFVVGGLICLVSQLLVDKTKLTPAKILVSYVCIGVFLTGIGVYGALVDFASSGATVPLTGFGYLLANGVKEAVDEKGLIGALTGGLSASAAGISAAISFAVAFAFLFKSRDRNI